MANDAAGKQPDKTPGYGEIHPVDDLDPESAAAEAAALEEPEGADTHGAGEGQ